MTEAEVKATIRGIFDNVAEVALANFSMAERMAFETMYDECNRFLIGDLELEECQMLQVRVELDKLSAEFIATEFVEDGRRMRALSSIIASARITAYRRMDAGDNPNIVYADTMGTFIYNLGNMGFEEISAYLQSQM